MREHCEKINNFVQLELEYQDHYVDQVLSPIKKTLKNFNCAEKTQCGISKSNGSIDWESCPLYKKYTKIQE